MRFYVGLHQPSDAHHFDRCMVSVKRVAQRKGPFPVDEWIMDSGAFSELSLHGHYRTSVAEYASQVRRWKTCGNLVAAVAQDYMCEPMVLARTGLTIADHQRLTIERYDALVHLTDGVLVLPVLQGYAPEDYVAHLAQYGERLPLRAWVGVGSVCQRNTDVGAIGRVLHAIATARPDLRLHGFGVKTTALQSVFVRDLLWSADSMAWSFASRKQGRGGNNWRDAERFVQRIAQPPTNRQSLQLHLI